MSALLVRGSPPNEEATTRGFVLDAAFCATGVYAPGPGISTCDSMVGYGMVGPNG